MDFSQDYLSGLVCPIYYIVVSGFPQFIQRHEVLNIRILFWDQ